MLSRKYKLKKDNDFKKVFRQGKYFQKDFIGLRILRNNLEINRFGFIVGLKVSKKAVQRNKIERWLEEIVRLKLDQVKDSFDIVIMAKPEIIGKDYQEIENTLISLFKESKILWN